MKKTTVLLMVLFLNFNFILIAQEEVDILEKSPNTNILFSELFLQLVATIILILLIKKFVWARLLNMLEERKKHINESILDATKAKQNAQIIEEEKSKELDDLRNKTNNILEESKKTAQKEQEQIIGEAKEKAKHILKKADHDIELNKKEVQSQLTKELAQSSVEILTKVLKDQMNDDIEKSLILEATKKVNNE